MHCSTRVFALLALLLAALPAAAKSKTVKIRITGGDIVVPLEITDRGIVDSFFVYTGPGVAINGKPANLDPDAQWGAFIDWPRGRVQRKPAGPLRFQVGFYCGGRSEWLCYQATYEYDPTCPDGFIYLPGRDDKRYTRNVSTIVHGVEGSWFRSSSTWESLVRPQIDRARRGLGPSTRTRFITPI
jgi:hypothetical protein